MVQDLRLLMIYMQSSGEDRDHLMDVWISCSGDTSHDLCDAELTMHSKSVKWCGVSTKQYENGGRGKGHPIDAIAGIFIPRSIKCTRRSQRM